MKEAIMTPPTATERRAIVDTHRHPWGKKMQAKIEERGLLDRTQGFPQTNALDLMAYREVFDLDYAVPIQREGGITLSLMTNGGEVAWLAQDLLKVAPTMRSSSSTTNTWISRIAIPASSHPRRTHTHSKRPVAPLLRR
jgi:hypothetical protein